MLSCEAQLKACTVGAQVIDRILYKLDELVRPFVHKILVVIEPLLIDEDYYARVEGREIIANLAKVCSSSEPNTNTEHLCFKGVFFNVNFQVIGNSLEEATTMAILHLKTLILPLGRFLEVRTFINYVTECFHKLTRLQ